MTDILEKTGLVERSGQGVDKIFSITLAEGKTEPDYTSLKLISSYTKTKRRNNRQSLSYFFK